MTKHTISILPIIIFVMVNIMSIHAGSTYTTIIDSKTKVFASSEYRPAGGTPTPTPYYAENIIDGDGTTAWASGANDDNAWIIVDLGMSKYVNRMDLTWHTNYYAERYSIAVSIDRLQWELIGDETRIGEREDRRQEHVLNTTTRYIRINCLEQAPLTSGSAENKTYYALMECEVLQTTADVFGSAGFSLGRVERTTLVLDNDGTPYVAYKDWSQNKKAVLMKYEKTSGTWQQLHISPVEAFDIALTIDKSGSDPVIYMAYTFKNNDHKEIRVMKHAAGTNTTVGPVAASYTDGEISLALNSTGTIYLAYLGVGGVAAAVMFDGAAWIPLSGTNPTFSVYASSSLAMAIDANDVPYFACSVTLPAENWKGWNMQRLSIMKFDGKWRTVGFPMFSGNRINYPSLYLDNTGAKTIPYIACMDMYQTSRAVAWRLTTGDALTGGIDFFEPLSNKGYAGLTKKWATHTTLIADGTMLYLSFGDEYRSGRASVMAYDMADTTGHSWKVVGAPGAFSPGEAQWMSSAIHKTAVGSTLYMVYTDWTKAGKATLVTYDLNTEVTP